MIVVSDIGEQWSPQTAPAIHAEMAIIISSFDKSALNTLTTIGIRIPKVPQLVPVAKARNTDTRKIRAGRRLISAPFSAKVSTTLATYSFAPRESVMALSVQAKVRIRIAGTILLNPSGRDVIHSVKERTLVARKNTIVIISAATEP